MATALSNATSKEPWLDSCSLAFGTARFCKFTSSRTLGPRPLIPTIIITLMMIIGIIITMMILGPRGHGI